MAEFAAGDRGRETVVADGDLLVDEFVREVVRAFGHCSNEDADALLVFQALHVFSYFDQGCIEGEGDLSAIGRKMVGDRILNDLEELFLGVNGSDGETVEELDHETCEALECTWNTNGRADFDQDTFGGVNVDLQLASFVDRRVEEGKQTL